MHLSTLLLSGLTAATSAQQRYPWDDPTSDRPQGPPAPQVYPWDDPVPAPPSNKYPEEEYSLYSRPTRSRTRSRTSNTAEPTQPTSSGQSTVVVTGTTTVVVTSTTRITRNPTDSNTIEPTMPSLSSIITTAVLTTSAILPTVTAVFPEAIEGLPDCDQSIVFDLLADSQCNPANFPCICNELARLQVRVAVAEGCTEVETGAYDAFLDNFCLNSRQVSTVSTPTPPTSSALPVNVSSSAGPFPFSNSTTPAQSTGALIQPSTITTEIVITTTNAAGNPSTTTKQTVLPVAPEFTGAATAFGTARYGILVGGIGLMGLVFAEL